MAKVTIESNFGKLLTENRARLGLSVRELARETGVDAQYIYNYESEKTIPLLDKAFTLAFYLDFSLDDLTFKIYKPQTNEYQFVGNVFQHKTVDELHAVATVLRKYCDSLGQEEDN